MMREAQTSGAVDLHSHLVPAVDDGSRTVEDVVGGVRMLREAGVTHVVTTPHLNGSLTLEGGAFEARMQQMDEAFERGLRAVKDALPELHFHRANEVALDHPGLELTDPRLRLGPRGHFLVEWPRLSVPPESAPTLQRLHEGGAKLLLAHPERYRMGDRWLHRVASWREAGAAFQVNYGSLVGQYGSEVRRRAIALLERGWVDCLATDFHGRPHLPIYIEEARGLVVADGRRDGSRREAWTLLTRTNPIHFLEGRDPLPVPPLSLPRSLWSRLTGRLW